MLHALDMAMEKGGRVTLNEERLFQGEEADSIIPFAGALPPGEPTASIVVSAKDLRRAAAGQERFVRLNFYGENQALELAGAGK